MIVGIQLIVSTTNWREVFVLDSIVAPRESRAALGLKARPLRIKHGGGKRTYLETTLLIDLDMTRPTTYRIPNKIKFGFNVFRDLEYGDTSSTEENYTLDDGG